MDDLRLILLICGIVLLVGIYIFEIVRRRIETRRKDIYAGYSLSDDVSAESLDETPFGDIERVHDLRAAQNAQSLVSGESVTEEIVEDPHQGDASEGKITPVLGDASAIEGADSGRVMIDDLAAVDGLDSVDEPLGSLSDVRVDSDDDWARMPETLELFSADDGAGTDRATTPPPPELVVVLTIMARGGSELTGEDLGEFLDRVGMEHGSMGVFHAYEAGSSSGHRITRFSLANAMAPGQLDPDSLAELRTPGFALFMRLPGPDNPLETFNSMLSVGMELAERLGGVLCDETHSTLTQQVIRHLQERIAEYGRRQLLR